MGKVEITYVLIKAGTGLGSVLESDLGGNGDKVC